MAIVIEAVGSVSDAEVSSVQFNLNIGTAANRCWVIATTFGQQGAISSVTVGSDSLTLSTTLQNSNNKAYAQIWWGTTSLTGTQTVTVSFSSNPKFINCGGYALSGVDQTTPKLDEQGAASQAGTTISAPALSGGAADSLGLDGLYDDNSTSSTSDNTSEWTSTVEATHGHGSSAVGSGPTMGYTSLSSGKDHAISAVLMQAASGGGPARRVMVVA